MSATVTVPVEAECNHADCYNDSEFAYIVTGDYGKDGVAVYCAECAEWADESENHTAIAEVDQ